MPSWPNGSISHAAPSSATAPPSRRPPVCRCGSSNASCRRPRRPRRPRTAPTIARDRADRLRRAWARRRQERRAASATSSRSATWTRAMRRRRPSSSRARARRPSSSRTSATCSSGKTSTSIVHATPDHWHTLINLAAAAAKKDIYAEKPLTLTIDEGKRLVKAVRKHRVVLQTGTQQRSNKLFRLACELARNGRIGKLTQVTVFVPAGLREGPFTPGRCRPASTGTSGSGRRRRWTTSRSAAIRRSAGGSTTREGRSPTGAPITTTSPAGPSGWTVRPRSRRGRRSSRSPAATPRRRSSRRRSPGPTA